MDEGFGIFAPLVKISMIVLGTIREAGGRLAHVRRQEGNPEHQMSDVAAGKNPWLEVIFCTNASVRQASICMGTCLYPTLFGGYVNASISELPTIVR